MDEPSKPDVILLARARTFARTGAGLAVRVSAGLSCAEVGDAVGAAPSTIWRWEHGERAPRGQAAIEWARLLLALQKAA